MSYKVPENQEASYICGKCYEEVYYSVQESAPPCPECGWTFFERSQYDVPDDLYFPLSK